MLPFVSGNNVYWLLYEVEIILVVARCGRKIEVSVYKSLTAGIEKCVNVGLSPSTLLDWLKF
jgi:hypothetical protein